MKAITTFDQFVEVYGLKVWRVQASARNQRHHVNAHCSAGVSFLIGGRGSCHECESDFADLLLHLYRKGSWLAPQGRATADRRRDEYGPAA